jgi:hypothetical protein
MKTIPIRSLLFLLLIILASCADTVWAESPLSVGAGATFVSRYNWRGGDYGDAAAIQPALTLTYKGFNTGFWGSYSANFEEIDTWASYGYQVPNSVTLTGIVTDYFFPDEKLDLFNYNNWDDPEGAGAHTIELGAMITGPEKFPLTFSAFVNVYNDQGKNKYFQLDYNARLGESTLGLTLGATSGSKKNPGYYGSDDFAIINVAARVGRSIEFTDKFSLPVFGQVIVNPNAEQAFMVFGFSL